MDKSGFVLNWVVFILSNVAVLPILEAKYVTLPVEGILCAVLTPLDDDGYVNTDIIPQYGQFLKDKRVDGIIVGTISGEGPTLSIYDLKMLIDAWVEVCDDLDLYILVEVGGAPLPEVLEVAAYADDAGVDAITCLPDGFYKPADAEDLVYYMEFVARAAPNTPVLYDDYPQYTDVYVDMVLFSQLATRKISNYKGIKTNNFDNALKLQDKIYDGQKIIVAEAIYLEAAVRMGFDTFCLSEISFAPKLVGAIVRNVQNGYPERSQSQYRRLLEIIGIVKEEGNVIPAQKIAVKLLTGLDLGNASPPLIPVSDEQETTIEENLREAGLTIV